MSYVLPDLGATRRYLGSVTPVGNNVTELLDAIGTHFAKVLYYAGDVRAPGAGVAWFVAATEGAPTEALQLTRPASSAALSDVVVAGYNGVKTPLMARQSWLANALIVGGSANGGVLSTWNHATIPLGAAARFPGYARSSPALGGAAGLLHVCESAEDICIFGKNGANFFAFISGAPIDPQVSGSALDAEADGRVYATFTSGSATLHTNLWVNSGVGWLRDINDATNPMAWHVTFGAGSATVVSAEDSVTQSHASAFTMRGGKYVFQPLHVRTGIYSANGTEAGVLRGYFRGPQAPMGTIKTGANGRIYIAISGSAGLADTVWVECLA